MTNTFNIPDTNITLSLDYNNIDELIFDIEPDSRITSFEKDHLIY